ncbi:hypothetical protein B4113_0102 [Geobacillus sp. B4113_201601]|nr:hypothetical protein B4113_0102 [Geobacillus sp. B4113_201601]
MDKGTLNDIILRYCFFSMEFKEFPLWFLYILPNGRKF